MQRFSAFPARLARLTMPAVEDADEAKNVQARALRNLLLGMLIWTVAFGALGVPFFVSRKGAAAGFCGVLLVSCLTAAFYLRRGHIRLASWIFLLTLWLVLTLTVVISGGFASPGLFSILVVTVSAAWLVSYRAAWISTGVYVALALVMALLEKSGIHLPRYLLFPPIMTWMSLLAVVGIGTLPLAQLVRTYHESLARAKRQVEELTRTQGALQASEDRYRAVVETSPDAITLTDLEGRIVMCNLRAAEIHGYGSCAELAGVSFLELLSPAERERARGFLQAAASGNGFRNVAARFLRKDGTTFPGEMSVSIIRDGNGQPAGIVGLTRDLTERKAAEEALRESEERFRAICENAPLGIALVDLEGFVVQGNPALCRLLGYTREELAGMTFAELTHPEDVQADQTLYAELMAGRRGQYQLEKRYLRKDGGMVVGQLSVSAIRDAGGKVLYALGLMEDITERRRAEQERARLEEQFRQAQKMESVGRLAGGVAHDFNNLLTVINGYSEMLLKRLAPGDPVRARVEQIKRAGDRAAELTQQLLAFSRKQVTQPRLLDLNAVIAESRRMLERLLGEDIELVTISSPALGCVMADPGQIHQVLMNLMVNAHDAMPQGGKLVVETADVELDESFGFDHPGASPGPYVRLAVSDTGTGMDADTLRQVFEPFFTTKGPGKGTGLGLSTVYGIVRQAGGWITAASEPGRGSVFEVYLPAVRCPAATGDTNGVGPEDLRGHETILVVEDEAEVRLLAAEVLENSGYRVLVAATGPEALQAAAAHPEPIHLTLTDVVMPGMNGKELAARLLALRPGMKILYMSGYSGEAVARRGVLDPGVPYIAKPFSSNALAAKVREVLGPSAPDVAVGTKPADPPLGSS